MNPDAPYPVQYSVDYPDRQLNRLSTFFRLFAVIPIAIVIGRSRQAATPTGRHNPVVVGAAGLIGGPLLLILFRRSTRAGGLTGTSN